MGRLFMLTNYLRMAYIRCLHWHLLLIRTGAFICFAKEKATGALSFRTEGRDCDCGGEKVKLQ